MDSEDTRKDTAVPTRTTPAHDLYRDIETVHSALERLVTANVLSDFEGVATESNRVLAALVGGAVVLRRLKSQPDSAVHMALGTVLLRGACHATLYALDTSFRADGPLPWQDRADQLRCTAENTVPPIYAARGVGRQRQDDVPFAAGLPRDAVAALKAFVRHVGRIAVQLGELETALEVAPYPDAIRVAEELNVEWGVLSGFRQLLGVSGRNRHANRTWVQPALDALRAVATKVIVAGSMRAAPCGSAAQALRRQLQHLELRVQRSGGNA